MSHISVDLIAAPGAHFSDGGIDLHWSREGKGKMGKMDVSQKKFQLEKIKLKLNFFVS